MTQSSGVCGGASEFAAAPLMVKAIAMLILPDHLAHYAQRASGVLRL
jgi:hypothetical protein